MNRPTFRRSFPAFKSPTMAELRSLYRASDDQQTRLLILEIVRLRRIITRAQDLRATIEKVWLEEVGSHFVALHALRLLLRDEGA